MHLQTDEAWRGQLDSPVNQTHETRGMVQETNTAMAMESGGTTEHIWLK